MKRAERLPKKFYQINRKKFLEKLAESSAAVFFAGEAPYKTGDERYTFSPDRNFLYLTGISAPKIIYFARKQHGKTEESLFIERANEAAAKWVGKALGAADATAISGITDIRYLDEFDSAVFNTVLSGIQMMYLDLKNMHGGNTRPMSLIFRESFFNNYPSVKISDGGKLVECMRGIKRDEEIQYIKNAIDVTDIAFGHILDMIAPEMYEYQIESCFDFALKYNGVTERAFDTIIASGKNATVLHYSDNSKQVKNGELVLLDFGATSNYYCADITRTIPVSGKFTDRQKELYNIVLTGQQKVMDSVRAGVTIFELNDILIEYYKEELKNAGLVGRKQKGSALYAGIEKYYWHKVGHSLGLNAHDAGVTRDMPLKPGMVITIEPGLYVEAEGIGIRIEDDILVTVNGYVNLSSKIPKTVDEIEARFEGAGNGS